jgi:hypothetical protein
MAKILKVIEILSESPNNWEEATQNVVTEASKNAEEHSLGLHQGFSRASGEVRPYADSR